MNNLEKIKNYEAIIIKNNNIPEHLMVKLYGDVGEFRLGKDGFYNTNHTMVEEETERINYVKFLDRLLRKFKFEYFDVETYINDYLVESDELYRFLDAKYHKKSDLNDYYTLMKDLLEEKVSLLSAVSEKFTLDNKLVKSLYNEEKLAYDRISHIEKNIKTISA